MGTKSTEHVTNLAQGEWQGVPENQHMYGNVKKNETERTKKRNISFFTNLERFPQSSEGSTAWRLLWYYEKR